MQSVTNNSMKVASRAIKSLTSRCPPKASACSSLSTTCSMSIARKSVRSFASRSVSLQTPLTSCVSLPLKSRFAVRTYSSGNLPPHVVLSMPALSPTMTQGNIGQYQKSIGDELGPGDVLVEIETDKAQMDFECQDEGFLAKILVAPGTKDVPVNTPIAILVENKDDIAKFENYSAADSSAAPKPAESAEIPAVSTPTAASTPAAASASTPSSGRIFATPIAKSIAAEQEIALAGVQGSGPDGLIIKKDITNFKKAPVVAKKETSPVAKSSAPITNAASAFKDVPLSNIRKVIADRLLESKVTIPHYYLTIDINADKALKLREILNNDSNGKYKLSVNDFIIKAAGLALRDVPEVNSAWHDTFIREYASADVAVAVATPTGLITPIVKSVEGKGLESISRQVKEMAGRAKEGKLAPHEYQGGTFTISNLGMFGISHFTAIINPPHAGILAIGTTTSKLVADESAEKGFSVQQSMNVTLSLDHRVVDGAVGAKWLDRFRTYMENPLKMML